MNDILTIDCRGMRCPAPILKLAKAARSAGKAPLVLEILADDGDFPNDLDAWCRTAKAAIHTSSDSEGFTRAVIGLNGAPPPTSSLAAEPTPGLPAASPPPIPTSPGLTVAPTQAIAVEKTELDLRGLQAPEPILRLSEALVTHGGCVVAVLADDPSFLADLMGWAAATRVVVQSTQSNASGTVVELQLPGRAQKVPLSVAPVVAVVEPVAPAAEIPTSLVAVADQTPAMPAAPSTLDPDAPPRENLATLLVIHNDFESLMAALMVASTSAAQGMDVCVYFSFWGVNLLRAEEPRANEKSSGVAFLQKMMKWMMPKGPQRQKMGQMHMAGVGKGMMEYFMRRNNVMSLRELIDSCVEQNVRFVVCSMSMGIMGIERRDIMELPNVEFAGVTCFTEMARKSAMSLTF